MIRGNLRFFTVILLVTIGLVAISLLHGGLLVGGYEGDLIHTVDIAYRLAEGEKPHQDFMTPLGVLTIYPLSIFILAGFGPGISLLMAQALVCLILLPMIAWVAISRLERGTRTFFALALIMVVTALVYGGDNPLTTVAIYYNRWAWAICSLIVITLLVAPKVENTRADALVIGICGAWLVLLKITYIVAILPFVLVAILYNRDWRLMFQALVVSLIILAGATVAFGGLGYWQGYIHDLLETLVSPIRSVPGEDYGSLFGKPAYLPGSAVMLASIVYFRKTGRMREGLLLLILFPGVVYITYQNWGNDPFWVFILAIALLGTAQKKTGLTFWDIDASTFQKGLALVALTIYSPALFNQAFSVPRHAGQDASEFAPMFSDPRFVDIGVRKSDNDAPSAIVPIAIETVFAEPVDEAEDDAEENLPVMVNGEELPQCDLSTGLVGLLRQMVVELDAVDLAQGKHVLLADLLDPLWLFGDYKRNTVGAPWYYGSDGGYETAEILMVPFCPVSIPARKEKLAALSKKGANFREVMRSELFILFQLEY